MLRIFEATWENSLFVLHDEGGWPTFTQTHTHTYLSFFQFRILFLSTLIFGLAVVVKCMVVEIYIKALSYMSWGKKVWVM